MSLSGTIINVKATHLYPHFKELKLRRFKSISSRCDNHCIASKLLDKLRFQIHQQQQYIQKHKPQLASRLYSYRVLLIQMNPPTVRSIKKSDDKIRNSTASTSPLAKTIREPATW